MVNTMTRPVGLLPTGSNLSGSIKESGNIDGLC